MKKTFTSKDFLLIGLMILLVVLLLLSMNQVDRQWIKLSTMENTLAEQSKDVSALRGSISTLQQKIVNMRVVSAQPVASNSVASAEVSKAAGKSKTNAQSELDAIPDSFKEAYKATKMKDYAQGGWFIDSFSNTLQTVTPLVATDAYASAVHSHVLESLLTRDPDTLKWQGKLAKSWQISDDGLTITFKLRDDVVFSDGEPFDSKDVVFTFNFIMNEKIKAPSLRAYYKQISSVKALNKYEVEFIFEKPYFKALAFSGGMDILSKHFYEPYLKNPEEFNKSKGLLIGTGPYRLIDPKNWKTDQDNIELVRNNRYWGPVQPSFDRFMWRIIQNDSARLTTFRNGDIDLYSGAQPIDFEKLKDDKQLNGISTRFNYVSPSNGYGYIGWNQKLDGKATRFADKRVRQAMTWLIDKQKIADDVYLGYRTPAVSPFGDISPQHDSALKYRGQDIAKGKALLKEAGFEDRDGDGVIEDKDGKPFEFELIFFGNNESSKRMVLLLKDMYARAGIKLKPIPSEWPVMLEHLDKKDFQAITLGWGGTIESDLYQIFHSDQIKEGDNRTSYVSKELDKIIEEARRETNEAKRMVIWHKAERILYEELPYTFLVRGKTIGFINKRIKNVHMTTSGLNAGGTDNYIPKALQKHSN